MVTSTSLAQAQAAGIPFTKEGNCFTRIGQREGLALVEFVRFGASRGGSETGAAEVLSTRTELRFVLTRFDRGEREGRPVVRRRRVRRR